MDRISDSDTIYTTYLSISTQSRRFQSYGSEVDYWLPSTPFDGNVRIVTQFSIDMTPMSVYLYIVCPAICRPVYQSTCPPVFFTVRRVRNAFVSSLNAPLNFVYSVLCRHLVYCLIEAEGTIVNLNWDYWGELSLPEPPVHQQGKKKLQEWEGNWTHKI